MPFFKIYKIFPVEIERAFNTCVCEVRKHRHARARATRARANKLSARANKLSKSQISSPNPLLESLFARARVSDGCAREHARASWPCSRTSRARASICSRVSRARLSVLAHLARACVKCSRACARTISTGNVSYVLKNGNIYICILYNIIFDKQLIYNMM